jgi:adenine/guanine/hypoxanthine permease
MAPEKEIMIRRFFALEELGTTIRQEFVAGATTFVTMVYIVVVNPKILEAAGIPFGPSMVATILSVFFGTLAMGIYAKRPFAIAPYMGENAFVAFTVVKVMGYSWQTALGAVFLGGALFAILTLVGIRGRLSRALPEGLKIGFAVGIGLFITFIGLHATGIVRLGVQRAPVHVGNLRDPAVLLAVFGFLLITLLVIRKVGAAILIGIVTVSLLAFLTGIAAMPELVVALPPSLSPTFLQLDVRGAFTGGLLTVVFSIFLMGFVDTMGTLIGLAYKADLLDESGNLPDIERPMMCDALSTVLAGILGTTTTGAFIESATGIAAGGKSGLTAVFIAAFFLLTLFFEPFFSSVPACAYGPALIVVGMLMLSPIARVNFEDHT